MRKLFILACVCALLFSFSAVQAQDPAVKDEKAEKKEDVKKDDKKAVEEKPVVKAQEKAADTADKPKVRTFQGGEIVVKEKAIANIEKASTTTEVTDVDIRARSEKTLDQTLEMVPGIKVETSHKGGKRFYMRGFDLDKVAILVDGVLVNDVYEANVDISQIPVMNASKVIVNRGVSSALYGTNGAIGSINVVTKKPEAFFAETNLEYGDYNNVTINAAHGMPIGDFYYWITATASHSDGYSISSKLDKDERTKWFNRLVRYDLYGNTLAGITLQSLDNYLNDTGKWNHTDYTKYNLAGKMGYSFSEKTEVGLSSAYTRTEAHASTFQANYFPKYTDATDTWANPSGTSLTTDGKSAGFTNRAFYWPLKYDLSVAPYAKTEFGDLTLRANAFYVRQRTNLIGWADQDHSIAMFPAAVVTDNNPKDNYTSIWTEQSVGMNIYPSYKLAKWNKLNFAALFRRDSHTAEEQALSSTQSPDIYAAHGNDTYKTTYVVADYLTLAIEDEIKLGNAQLTAGISYDAQNFVENKYLNTTVATGGSDHAWVDKYMAKDDSMIWGTRDSINPVLGFVYSILPETLKARAAFSSKTKFPPLSAYARLATETDDLRIKPERSYNGNAGLEYSIDLKKTELTVSADYFYSRFVDKIERIYIETAGITTYTNIDGAISQGVELLLTHKAEKLTSHFSSSISIGYTYTHAERLDNTEDVSINKGKKFEFTPIHVFLFDIRLTSIAGTSFNIFGQYTRNQVMYALKEAPVAGVGPYSTKYFQAVELHNPLMVNVKISQKILEKYEVYILCRNVLDDYNADPFNPGPGRMFYIGGGAKF
ncbi:MAG: hypothetical protein EPN93_15330 [Spirochaetes bacterium]|nr:MAG: hypothetical protein EPN93_15330 [Spirochaetota bacterium]